MELIGHRAVFLDQLVLVRAEAVVDVVALPEIHSRFPEVHAARFEDAPDQRLHIHVQVEDEVGRDREAVQAPQPRPIDPANARAGQRGEDVAIGQHDEAGFQSRNDFLLQPIGEVRGVEQDEGQLVQRVARLRQLDRRLHQLGARPAGLDDAVPFHFEPFAQQLDLRAAPDAVGPLDGNQFSRIRVERQVGNALAVVPAGLNAAIGAAGFHVRRGRHRSSPRGVFGHAG